MVSNSDLKEKEVFGSVFLVKRNPYEKNKRGFFKAF